MAALDVSAIAAGAANTVGGSAELQAACFEYYMSQQALAKAEDDHLTLQSVSKQLDDRVADLQAKLRDAHAARDTVAKHRQQEAALPHGVPAAAFDAYVEKEKRLLANIGVRNDALQCLTKETEQLREDLVSQGQTATLLEEVLDSQCKYNKVLTTVKRKSSSALDAANKASADRCARLTMLQAEQQAVAKREAQARAHVRLQHTARARAQDELVDRDMDGARLRKDVAFAQRMYWGEMAHAREQEAQVAALLAENRRLKGLVDDRRKGRPVIHKGHVPASVARPPQASTEGGAVPPPTAGVATHDKRTGSAAFQAVPVESNDETENFRVSFRPTTEQGRLLEQFRTHNVALLQQMVHSVQALQMQLDPPAKAPVATATVH